MYCKKNQQQQQQTNTFVSHIQTGLGMAGHARTHSTKSSSISSENLSSWKTFGPEFVKQNCSWYRVWRGNQRTNCKIFHFRLLSAKSNEQILCPFLPIFSQTIFPQNFVCRFLSLYKNKRFQQNLLQTNGQTD